MVIYLFPEWEKLSAALATTENYKVDMFDYPIGAPSEDLYVEGGRTHGAYLDIWEKLRRKSQSEKEIALLDRVVFFNRVRLEVGKDWIRRYGTDWEARIELPLTPTPMYDGDIYIDNPWNFLDCALSPNSVREVCEAAKSFEIEDYKSGFHALKNRGSLFEDFEPDDPAADFENFKRYYASWHAALVDAASENCGLLVFCW